MDASKQAKIVASQIAEATSQLALGSPKKSTCSENIVREVEKLNTLTEELKIYTSTRKFTI